MGSRIYIGRLNYEVRERDLEKFFKGYGRIKEILIKNGFGFVEFDDYRDAEDAVYDLNGKELLGDRVTIEHARGSPRGNDMYRDRNRGYRAPMQNRRRGQGGGRDKRYGPPTRTEYRLIVENLSSRVSWQDLKDYMRQAGEVTYADAHKQRRNEGVVEFATFSDMKNAIEKLDDTDLSGRHIKLVEDKSRGRGRRSRSRSRSKSSRSHSRSRSRSRSKSHSMSRSRSRSRSKSASKARSNRSLSRKKSGSRSPSPRRDRDSRNRGSRDRNSRDRASRDRNSRDRASRDRNSREKGSRDRDSRSRSKSNKSRSRSRSKSVEKRSRTPSPVQKIDDASNSADEKK